MKTLLAYFVVVLLVVVAPATLRANGRLVLSVVDQATGKPIAARMHLKNVQGKAIKPPGAVNWGDHFVFSDKIALKLPNGGYEFVIERGPEYHDVTGHFNIENFADDTKTVELRRFVDMAKEGWFSGDLDVRRPEKDLELLMRADDVHVVPLLTWSGKLNPWTKRQPPKDPVSRFEATFFYSLLGGDLSTPGNPLRVLRLSQPPLLPDDAALKTGTGPLGSLALLPWIEQVRREQNAWVDAGAMFARDLPIWIAAGLVDSIELAGGQLERSAMARDKVGIWPRDKSEFPDPYGSALWSQSIYYHLLNCGLRIAPTAGSGSGVNNNPVGYNRVYVHATPTAAADSGQSSGAPPSLTWDDWWNALRAGRVTVTNGPLLRPVVEGQLPGHVFRADAGKPLELLIGLTLSTRDKIRYLEIVKNGRPEEEINLDQWKAAGGKLPPLKFTESGWFLVRAVCENAKTYRFATTAPYYVEIGYQPRISRASAQFFLDWTNRRAEEVAASKPNDAAGAQTARQYIERAQSYWQAIRDKATAD